MFKCPECKSKNHRVKYGNFIECKDCGIHYYGVYEKEAEPAVEEVVEEEREETPKSEEEVTEEKAEDTKPKRQVGKPAVKGKVG